MTTKRKDFAPLRLQAVHPDGSFTTTLDHNTCPVCGSPEVVSEGIASDDEGQAEEVYERGSCICGATWIKRAIVRWYETEITKGGDA